jgi:FkbM family methyltransferase
MTKRLIRRLLGRFGYAIRSVGDVGSVTGIDLMHDVQVLLGEKRPLILFDVGGNIGQTVASFLETFHDSHVYSFEPSPKCFETMHAAYNNDSRVRLENLALGDQEGVLPFQVTRDHSVNDSLLEPVWDAQAKSVPVQVSTLDRYCPQHHVEFIDYLKVDTQGYDLKVLQGGRDLLTKQRIRTFSAELIFAPMYKDQPSYIQLLSFPEQFGYQLVGIYEQTYRHGRLNYANALFISGKGLTVS